MITKFRASFAKDLKGIKDKKLLKAIKTVIEQTEQAKAVSEILNLKKLKGEDNFYRIRLGDYRIGLFTDNDEVEFIRFLHRKEVYRYFP